MNSAFQRTRGGAPGSMAEAEADAGDVRDDAPNPMVLMGDILEKLKILQYEDFARRNLDGRLLHAAYFMVPHPKPNEQFHYFTQLFAFLMKLNKFSFEAPDEFDDPNSTVANMMEVLVAPRRRAARRTRCTHTRSQQSACCCACDVCPHVPAACHRSDPR